MASLAVFMASKQLEMVLKRDLKIDLNVALEKKLTVKHLFIYF